MPAVIAAAIITDLIVQSVLAPLVLSAVISGTTFAILSAVIGGLVTYAVNAVFSDKPDQPQFQGYESEIADRLLTVRQPIAPWQTIYGRARVGGAITFLQSPSKSILNMVITLACHEVQEIEQVWLDDEVLDISTSGNGIVYGKYAYTITTPGTRGFFANEPGTVPDDGIYTITLLHTPDSDYPYITYGFDDRVAQFVTGVPQNYGEVQKIDATHYKFYSGAANEPYGLQYWYGGSDPTYTTDSKVKVFKSLGNEADGVQPFPGLVTSSGGVWSNTHRQTERAKIWIQFQYDQDLFPSGLPNVTAVIKGRNDIYDPRGPSTGWSQNAALCVANYLTDAARGGGFVYADDINEAQLIAAANVCDQAVDIGIGGSLARYTLNGSYHVEGAPRDVLARMLTSMAGNCVLVGGEWFIQPASYVTPTLTLTQSDLRGAVHILPRLSRRDLANSVKGIYVSPENSWQASDFPPVTATLYVTEDQGEVIWRELDLPWTTNSPTAQRIAKIELERTRQQITVELPCKLAAYDLIPGDTVMVTIARYGWSAKVFEVVSIALVQDETDDGPKLGVDIILRETASQVFDWATNEETVTDWAPDTDLPDPFDVGLPISPLLTDEIYIANDGTIRTRLIATWGDPGDAWVTGGGYYEIEYKKTADSIWTNVPDVRGDHFVTYMWDVEDLVEYHFRIRSKNPLGKRSDWVTSANYTTVGKSAPPSDVTGTGYTHLSNGTKLTWNGISDLDADLYEIRQGVDWATGTLVHSGRVVGYVVDPLPTGITTFWIKAIDTSGNYSTNATQLDVTVVAPGAVTPTIDLEDGRFVIYWDASTGGSYLVDYYEVRFGASWAGSTFFGEVDATELGGEVDWTSSKTWWVSPYDVGGNRGTEASVVGTVDPPNAPVVMTAFNGDHVEITWTPGQSDLPIEEYDVRYGATWETGLAVGKVKGNKITVLVDWSGSRTFWVNAVNIRGTTGTAASAIATTVDWGAPAVDSEFIVAKVNLFWQAPAGGNLPIKEYEIRYGASYAAGTFIAVTTSRAIRIPADWTGSRTFWVAAIDSAGNTGAAGSKIVTVDVPTAPSLTTFFELEQAVLNWTAPISSSIPIDEYEIRYGSDSDTWGTAAFLQRVKGTSLKFSANWSGARRFFVAAIDLEGNVGADDSETMTVVPPAAVTISAQVVDNNVLLFWTEATATLPVKTYRIKRGDTWAGGTLIGNKSGGFTTVFETVGGTFKYWIAGIDTAGNEGTPASFSATVSQPPDYVFLADYDSAFSGTFSNSFLDSISGHVVMPVDTTQTWATHFTGNSWTTIADQISAGYPIYIEPTVASGYYEEHIDYGTIIPSSKITVTPTATIVDGTPTVTCKISVSDDDSSWTDYNDTYEVFATAFRYIKVRITIGSSGGDDVYEMSNLNIRLDVKLKGDAGTVNARAGGSVTGITRSGTTASVTTSGSHGKNTGDAVEIAGANETDYNGVFEITVTGANTFDYEVANSPSTPATGTITWDNGGTPVIFTQTFIDITSITVTPKGTSPIYGIYDFTDTPNPTYFKVLLFNSSGTRISGDASWSVKGY